MNTFTVVLAVCILASLSFTQGRSSSCYSSNMSPYRRMGQKTSYFVNSNNDDSEITIPGCDPVMLWYLGRHGARKPSDKEIVEMAVELPALQESILAAALLGLGEMCEQDLTNLRDWTFKWTEDDHKLLMESGVKEQLELGERWGRRLPSLLGDSNRVQVRATYKQRTWASAKSFLYGLYGYPVSFPQNIVPAMLLSFYEFCPAYMDGVDSNNNTFVEKYTLMASPEYREMVDTVSQRVGLVLETADVEMAWAMCRYEIAEYPDVLEHVSPWCALFSEDDLKILEFADDLMFYWKDGYGFDINWKMTQPLMAEMHQKFSQLKSGDPISTLQSYLYFGHSESTNNILAALGLYRDPHPLLASQWPTQDHKWQTSKILSFSHNLALVAMQCENTEEPFNILALHQERKVVLPACGEELCPLQKFLDSIQDIVDVDFEAVCQYN